MILEKVKNTIKRYDLLRRNDIPDKDHCEFSLLALEYTVIRNSWKLAELLGII